MDKKKEFVISGLVKIKRKRFWADRYAEIQNCVFFYFKSKGDINARGVIQLKGSVVQERLEKPNEKIIVILNPNCSDKQNETIQLKLDNELEHQEWLKHLTSASAIRNSFLGQNNNNDLDIETNSTVNNCDSCSRPSKKKENLIKSANNIMKNFNSERDIEIPGNNHKGPINNYTLIDNDFLKNNIDGKLNSLKTEVSNFIEEKKDDYILVDNNSGLRIFYKRIKNSKRFNFDFKIIKNLINKTLNFVYNLQNILGNFNFYIILVIAILIFLLVFYMILEVTNSQSFFISLAFTINFIAMPFIYTEFHKKDGITQGSEEGILNDWFQEVADFKIKVILPIPININDILCILTNISARKNWQPNISSLTEANVQGEKQIKVSYRYKETEYFKEKYIQSFFKEKDFVYIIEHFNHKILRVFQIKMNHKSNYHLLKYYTIVDNLNVNIMNPAYNPLLLTGLINYYNELRLDTNSFLNEYYKKNKYLLTDEEDDEDLLEDDKKKENTNRLSEKPLKYPNLLPESKSFSQKIVNEEEGKKENIEPIINKIIVKKPVLPANLSDSYKEYYNLVDKCFEQLVKEASLDQNNWNFIETKEECTIHTRQDNSSGFTWARGEIIIEKDKETIKQYIENLDKKNEYDNMFAEGKTFETISEGFTLSYQKFKGIFPVGPRDFVMAGASMINEKDSLLMVATSIVHPEYPPVKGVTRGHLYLGGWILEKIEEGKTKAVFLNLNDPKGSIPKKILEYAAKNQGICPLGVKKRLMRN